MTPISVLSYSSTKLSGSRRRLRTDYLIRPFYTRGGTSTSTKSYSKRLFLVVYGHGEEIPDVLSPNRVHLKDLPVVILKRLFVTVFIL